MQEIELESLLDYRRELDAIAAEPRPAARILSPLPRPAADIASVAVLAGAFNPPTRAHVALVEAAKRLGFDAVLFSLGRVTLDKDSSGLLLEDRLQLLETIARSDARLGVVVQNRGLYSEMAQALHHVLGGLRDLAFLIGMDKVPQLFDARYYDDLEPRLEALFERARFLVAPRAGVGRKALEVILESPPARRYTGRFEWLPLGPEWHDVSATDVRRALARGSSVESLLLPEVAEFLRRTGGLADEARYRARTAELERAADAARRRPQKP